LGKNSNGALVKLAEDAGFDLLLTTDKNLRYQQNLLTGKSLLLLLDNHRGGLFGGALTPLSAQ
jgi:hypothetical protein